MNQIVESKKPITKSMAIRLTILIRVSPALLGFGAVLFAFMVRNLAQVFTACNK
jgi:hypothetical protein